MLHVRYKYGWSLLSVLCVHFIRISVRLLEAHGYGRNVAVAPEIVGAVSGGVAYSLSKTSAKYNEEEYFGKMAELFKERLCRLVCNYRCI